MKVKNGIASSVSFDMMPQSRSGMAPSSGQNRVIVSMRIGRQLDADEEEQQAVGGQREGDRIAEQQEDDQRGEHDRRHVLGDELSH